MTPCPSCLYYRTSCGDGCRTPRCPGCLREPGDVHGPNCGEIMAAKLGDPRPATITRADCDSRTSDADTWPGFDPQYQSGTRAAEAIRARS